MKQTNSSVSRYVFLVVVFFIPLFSNLLHYVIIEHEFGKRSRDLEWIDGSKVHYCDQYLFKIHPAIEVPLSHIDLAPFVYYKTLVLHLGEMVQSLSPSIFYNRGPPSG